MNTTKVRILCVDDDPLQRKLYQAILENESCEVDLATNGEEGLAKFKQNVEAGFNYYGLVITDRGMPQMNGSELVVRIKQLEEEKRRKQPAYLPTPIVMITGSTLEVDEKKKVLLEKLKIDEDPVQIKIMIQKLETKIETEPMPFEQEKKITKKIKELKAKFKELEKLGTQWSEINQTNTDFYETRKKAEESHHNVQVLAHQSQEKHEEINKLYEEVKEFRKEEQPFADKYLKLKAEYEEIRKTVEELQLRVTELAKLLNEDDERSFKTIAQEKTAEVKEKLRKGKKLSTEDILAFQAMRD